MRNDLNIKNTIAANISYYRKAAGLTQRNLAEKLDVKTTTVSTWERGSSLPDAETLFAICYALDISLATIYGTDVIKDSNFTLTATEQHVIHAYRAADQLSKDMVHRILGLDQNDAIEDKMA